VVGVFNYSYEIDNQSYHINKDLAKRIGLIPTIKEDKRLD
jgi:hypothetical protein